MPVGYHAQNLVFSLTFYKLLHTNYSIRFQVSSLVSNLCPRIFEKFMINKKV